MGILQARILEWELGDQSREEAARSLRPPFLPPSVSGSSVELPTALCWDRASGGSQPLVRRINYEEGPGKTIPFSVENKWRLLAMMTLFFEYGFAAPFFIVRHQLLKK
ncbi:hypothetical protein FD755_018504 [Muntiacus reevesi]|uniref:Cytochrome c oxidase subunit 7C, mitochondrial n=1 Tax=Muntiacus reevesi TaxID=9886 RepID=A0A5N3X5U3_MUNRE|nr:hypothetical protein FD755_018504 [Muntiacus reevesi]